MSIIHINKHNFKDYTFYKKVKSPTKTSEYNLSSLIKSKEYTYYLKYNSDQYYIQSISDTLSEAEYNPKITLGIQNYILLSRNRDCYISNIKFIYSNNNTLYIISTPINIITLPSMFNIIDSSPSLTQNLILINLRHLILSANYLKNILDLKSKINDKKLFFNSKIKDFINKKYNNLLTEESIIIDKVSSQKEICITICTSIIDNNYILFIFDDTQLVDNSDSIFYNY